MIKYTLRCDNGHNFEGWFSSSADFDTQKSAGYVACPQCGSQMIEKGLMAPSVSTARKQAEAEVVAGGSAPREMMEFARKALATIRDNCEDVGERFVEEARKIHYGEAESRGIMGKASVEDVGALVEEGIDVMPLPRLPEDAN